LPENLRLLVNLVGLRSLAGVKEGVQSALSAAHDQQTTRPALYDPGGQSTNQILHRSAATMTGIRLKVYRTNNFTLSAMFARTAMPRAF
jgi:hypothetical protein